MILLTYGAARNAFILLVLCLHTFVLVTVPTGSKLHTIYWNSSNPIFHIGNTDTVIDVNKNNLKFHYDQVNLICPVYAPETRYDDTEKYMIYNVSKDEYEACRITNPYPRLVALCDEPYKLVFFTITFRPFSPIPGGLEFLPGYDYYFISTSLDVYRKCTRHNMKIIFKIWPPPVDGTTEATTSFCRPIWFSILPSRTTTTKSTEAPTNEMVKSEELALGGSGVSKAEAVSLVIIAVALIVIIVGILLLVFDES